MGFWLGCLAAGILGASLARCDLPTEGWVLPAQAAASPAQALPARAPGPVSIGFAQDMSLHHEQALLMAGMALQLGTPPMRPFAQGVLHAQQRELGLLQGWLMLWDAPAASATGSMDWMRDAYRQSRRRDEAFESFIEVCGSTGSMPGLATAEQLQALSALQGAAFDRLFLQLMARHHQGAVVMAQFAYQYAELDAVRGFALAMGAEQRKEWALMAGLMRVGP